MAGPRMASKEVHQGRFIVGNLFHIILTLQFCLLYLVGLVASTILSRRLFSRSCLFRLCLERQRGWHELCRKIEQTRRVEPSALHKRDMAQIQLISWKWLTLFDFVAGMAAGLMIQRTRSQIVTGVGILFQVSSSSSQGSRRSTSQ